MPTILGTGVSDAQGNFKIPLSAAVTATQVLTATASKAGFSTGSAPATAVAALLNQSYTLKFTALNQGYMRLGVMQPMIAIEATGRSAGPFVQGMTELFFGVYDSAGNFLTPYSYAASATALTLFMLNYTGNDVTSDAWPTNLTRSYVVRVFSKTMAVLDETSPFAPANWSAPVLIDEIPFTIPLLTDMTAPVDLVNYSKTI